jgi:hypothetical protein
LPSRWRGLEDLHRAVDDQEYTLAWITFVEQHFARRDGTRCSALRDGLDYLRLEASEDRDSLDQLGPNGVHPVSI